MCHRQPVTCSAWEMMSTLRRRTTPSSTMTAAGRGTSSASPMWPKLQSLHKVPLTRLWGQHSGQGAKESLELSHRKVLRESGSHCLVPSFSPPSEYTAAAPRSVKHVHGPLSPGKWGIIPNRPLLNKCSHPIYPNHCLPASFLFSLHLTPEQWSPAGSL